MQSKIVYVVTSDQFRYLIYITLSYRVISAHGRNWILWFFNYNYLPNLSTFKHVIFLVVYFSVHKTWHVKAKKVEIYNKKEAFQNSRLRKQKSSGGNERENEPP